MACNPRCNSFNVLCSICWFSFLLWCYDHLCVVTRCEYIHIWEENRKSKQTDEKKKTFATMKMLLLFLGEKAGTWPSRNRPRPPTGVIIRPRFGPNGVAGQRSGLGSVQRELPCSSSNGRWEYWITSSASLSFLPFMCSQDFNCKDKRKKNKKQPSTLSLLSLQRYETSFSMVCCKNRAFFFLFF